MVASASTNLAISPSTGRTPRRPTAGLVYPDDILNDPGISCDAFTVATCEDGVSILDQRDIYSGKKIAKDAAYTLAMHLLAAQLNIGVGAESCPVAREAVLGGHVLLASVGFDGRGDRLQPKHADYDSALTLTEMLDLYSACRRSRRSWRGLAGVAPLRWRACQEDHD